MEHSHTCNLDTKEVEICATNLANKTKGISTNAETWKTICEDFLL
jgi:hypothetical protein